MANDLRVGGLAIVVEALDPADVGKTVTVLADLGLVTGDYEWEGQGFYVMRPHHVVITTSPAPGPKYAHWIRRQLMPIGDDPDAVTLTTERKREVVE